MKSKPWQLTKWREARKEFLKGKCCEWYSSKEELVIHHPQAKYSLSSEKYKSFEGTIVLCKKCHFALHKGFVLCQVSKKNYHEKDYGKCWRCYKKKLPSEKVWKSEYHPYEHPWCKKTFKIKGEWWEIEADPEMCCIEVCEENPNVCEVAREYWGKT